MRVYPVAIASAFIFNAFLSADVIAAPEEIQVYLDEFEEVGKPGLDLHTNYVTSGKQLTDHQLRVTPEFSYGINNNWEVAAYFLAVKDPGEAPETDGMKLRAKWRPKAPSADSPFYWAINFEAGALSRRFYQDKTSGEIKLIGVWKTDPWTLGINYNIDRSLKSHPVEATNSEIDAKVSYQIREGLQVGIENYSFLGAIHNDPSQPQNNASNYLVADFNLGKWNFNAGIGRVSGRSPDNTVLKAIIGVPF